MLCVLTGPPAGWPRAPVHCRSDLPECAQYPQLSILWTTSIKVRGGGQGAGRGGERRRGERSRGRGEVEEREGGSKRRERGRGMGSNNMAFKSIDGYQPA